MLEMEKVSLANIGRGAAVEIFDRELAIVLANIADPNTRCKTQRKVTLEVTIVPSEDRAVGAVTINASSKLAPVNGVEVSFDLVQEGRHQVAYQRKGKQGELELGNVAQIGGSK